MGTAFGPFWVEYRICFFNAPCVSGLCIMYVNCLGTDQRSLESDAKLLKDVFEKGKFPDRVGYRDARTVIQGQGRDYKIKFKNNCSPPPSRGPMIGAPLDPPQPALAS